MVLGNGHGQGNTRQRHTLEVPGHHWWREASRKYLKETSVPHVVLGLSWCHQRSSHYIQLTSVTLQEEPSRKPEVPGRSASHSFRNPVICRGKFRHGKVLRWAAKAESFIIQGSEWSYCHMLTILHVTDMWEEWSLFVHSGQGYHALRVSMIPGCIYQVRTLLERCKLPVFRDIGKGHRDHHLVPEFVFW